MKTSYEVRAMRFAKILAKLFENCVSLADYEKMISIYNQNHSIPLNYSYGISRIAIIRSDYVIKFDYGYEKFYGDCTSEQRVYEQAVEDGMEYLLAKSTAFSLFGHNGSIMPRIKGVDNRHKHWEEHCTADEYLWLYEHIFDLHSGNVGYKNRKVCVIDYAAEK